MFIVVILPIEYAEKVLEKTKQITVCDYNCMVDLLRGVSFEEASKKHRQT